MRVPVAFGVIAALLAVTPFVAAHSGGGIGVEARIAFPSWLVWVAGAGVVALSFGVIAAFETRLPPRRARGAVDSAPRVGALNWLSLAFLLGIIAHAVTGPGLAPDAAVWFVVWGVVPLVAYSTVDVWPRLNPFAALGVIADALRARRAPFAYPSWLSAWPAVASVLALTGLEVWTGSAATGQGLARLVGGYTVVTFIGMTAFGAGPWLTHAEGVTRSMHWWGLVSPLTRRSGTWQWRLPGDGLADARVTDLSGIAFVVALLFGVNFDAFLATGTSAAVVDPVTRALGAAAAHVAALVVGFAAFLAVLVAAAAAVRRAALTAEPALTVAARFAASVMPIAVGYHVAHNVFGLIERAPVVLAAAADPFGLGWNLGGVAPAATLAPLPDAWLTAIAATQVMLIIAGHVLAVVVAHHVAVRAFPSEVQALRGEVPLTGVMVAYTVFGLWLVSQGHVGVV